MSIEEIVSSGLLNGLDADILEKYPGEPVNGVDSEGFHESGGYFVGARLGSKLGTSLVGCGAFRPFDVETVEIKRMYVVPAFRGRGISRMMLDHLETEARRLGYLRSILETGTRQTEAISLYASGGYSETAAFEPYIGNENSVCFTKPLRRET